MGNMKILLFCLIAAVYLVSEGDSECCSGATICKDCTQPTFCCGKGSCNIFCCNCDHGCRQPPGQCGIGILGKRALAQLSRMTGRGASDTAHDVISAADTDKDGRLSFAEARHYVVRRSADDVSAVERRLMEADLDGDNFFSPDEIDS